ncbi:hypothetical protein CEUSTIGMA_g8098.t1 [Chlamydomonas eustigma]|uniref:Sulfotransferase domain-containing protein n=1 Tax=Chlamydomonas eustigma TaxID=1157962 RepID=A0A250XC56_9CHLO|nr:hypothetical protein CEUSTIGMA_g8098.t1 [Chlamydomonas eustigma]|eukprot:GAX80663.1 hypothetical protein CEUSTIGMA_g8098.t1 [Chlamydomonas eustigma]
MLFFCATLLAILSITSSLDDSNCQMSWQSSQQFALDSQSSSVNSLQHTPLKHSYNYGATGRQALVAHQQLFQKLDFTQISVVGERHSGTTFLKRLLDNNLELKSLRIKDWFCDFKHYHQVPQDRRCPNLNKTLVLIVFRNPYDWAFSMHQNCWCRRVVSEQKEYTTVNFRTFMTRIWANDTYSMTAPDPWKGPGRDPATGRPYCMNIMQCRAIKLRNHMEISKWAPHVEFVRHEDIITPDQSVAWLLGLMAKYKLRPSSSEVQSVVGYKSRPWPFHVEAAMRKSVWFNPSQAAHNTTLKDEIRLITSLMDIELEKEVGCYMPIKEEEMMVPSSANSATSSSRLPSSHLSHHPIESATVETTTTIESATVSATTTTTTTTLESATVSATTTSVAALVAASNIQS